MVQTRLVVYYVEHTGPFPIKYIFLASFIFCLYSIYSSVSCQTFQFDSVSYLEEKKKSLSKLLIVARRL